MINHVSITGRLTKDPVLRAVAATGKSVATLSVALDRGKNPDGSSRGADYVSVSVFGPTAEHCERYLKKGSKVSIDGKLHSGMYEGADGRRVFTLEVVAQIVEFMAENKTEIQDGPEPTEGEQMGFIPADDIPF